MAPRDLRREGPGFRLVGPDRDVFEAAYPHLSTPAATKLWRGLETYVPPQDFTEFLYTGSSGLFFVETDGGRLVGLIELLGLDRSTGRGQLSIASWGPPLLRARTTSAVWLAIDEWFVTLPLKIVAVLLTQSTMRSVGRSLERFFVREGILRSAISLGGKSEDVHCFSLTRCEFVAALNQHERLRRLSTTWKALQE